MIQQKSNILRNIRIGKIKLFHFKYFNHFLGRHISLKQIAANVTNRAKLNADSLPTELKDMLAIF